MSNLYENAQMGATSVSNRVYLAPLTRNRALPDGSPSDLHPLYYSQRASGGLLITEATQISAQGKGYINTPGIYSDDHIAGWKKVTDAVHEKGGKIFVQLWHVGRISHTSLQEDDQAPVAPSAIRANAQVFNETGPVDTSDPRELTVSDIAAIVADYRHAAEAAKKAGFDGVELHAANGYLIDQFLQDHSNKRTDSYGGSVENRSRFLFEALDQVVDVWGADRVGIRLSPTGTFNDMGDSDPENIFGAVIDRLNGYGLAYLHLVESFPGIDSSEEEHAIIKRLRQRWNGFYVANGGYDRERGEEAVTSGHADAVAFGRPFIANPDLPHRLQSKTALNEPDQATFYGGDAKGYTDYPFANQAA